MLLVDAFLSFLRVMVNSTGATARPVGLVQVVCIFNNILRVNTTLASVSIVALETILSLISLVTSWTAVSIANHVGLVVRVIVLRHGAQSTRL